MFPPSAMQRLRSRASTACFCSSVIGHSSRYARSFALKRSRFSAFMSDMQDWLR